MKLKKFKERDNKRIGIIVFTIVCILLVSGVILYRTFAIFEVKTTQNVIKGTVQDPGNIYFAFYVNDEIQKDMPQKNGEYIFDEENSYCGVTGGDEHDSSIQLEFDKDRWSITVVGLKISRTKCNLKFVSGAYILDKPVKAVTSGDGLYKVTHGEEVTGTLNDTGFKQTEWRYAGTNPNNYITFNNETWRIIGLVNVMTDENTVEQRVKIIRNDSLEPYSWDTSASNINRGFGVNEWSESDLMKLLNADFEENKLENSSGLEQDQHVNNSLYWNHRNGNCYSDQRNTAKNCNFENTGLLDSSKSMIKTVIWNTGTNGTTEYWDIFSMNQFYSLERSSNLSDICKSEKGGKGGDECNDDVQRKEKWQGDIGLIYPSDYGYATTGFVGKTSCKNMNFDSWESNNVCFKNDWIFNGNNEWLMTSNSDKSFGYTVYYITDSGRTGYHATYLPHSFRPTLYLKTNVKIVNDDNDGSEGKPYVLQQV